MRISDWSSDVCSSDLPITTRSARWLRNPGLHLNKSLDKRQNMIGFQIHQRRRAVDANTTKQYRQLPVANVSDVMSRMYAGGAKLRPMHDGTPMAGPAIPVRCRPGDNLLVHKATEVARRGDVIGVDGGGTLNTA